MTDRFWIKSYGQNLPDLPAEAFEIDAYRLFKKSLEKYKNETALIFMGVEITFGRIDACANMFAHMLLANGFKKGDLLGINLPNIPEYCIAWLGAMKVGCVTSGVSPLLSPAEMEHQLKDSDAKGLVTLDVLYAQRAREIAPRLPALKLIVAANVGGFLPKIKQVLGKLLKKLPSAEVGPLPGKTVMKFGDLLKPGAYPAIEPPGQLTPDDVCYIMYTGGTTGLPKGAVLTHRNNAAEIQIATKYMGWDQVRGKVISAFPMFHIAGLTFNTMSFYNGWTQLMLPDPRNTDFICQLLEKHRPFLICNVPSMYYMLMANPKFRALDHSQVQQCVSAAAPFPVDSQKEFEGIVGRGKLIELYGMTESTAISVMNPIKGQKKLGTVGLPLMNTDLKLVDPTNGEKVGVGQAGEIWIKNPMVMKEYYKKPAETAAAFDAEGFLRTGDVAVQDEDGYLTLVDRTKDMIIVSGYKVFSKKVEDLLADHPAVEIMALIGVPNPDRPGSEMVKAYVKLKPGFSGDVEAVKKEIVELAKAKLAPYEVPKMIEILKELPLTSVGKLDKKALRQMTAGK
ncbi:MAG: AMP-binding protein [Thermodesulfobacteriota bacterium]